MRPRNLESDYPLALHRIPEWNSPISVWNFSGHCASMLRIGKVFFFFFSVLVIWVCISACFSFADFLFSAFTKDAVYVVKRPISYRLENTQGGNQECGGLKECTVLGWKEDDWRVVPSVTYAYSVLVWPSGRRQEDEKDGICCYMKSCHFGMTDCVTWDRDRDRMVREVNDL
jgi:hypothetical protein